MKEIDALTNENINLRKNLIEEDKKKVIPTIIPVDLNIVIIYSIIGKQPY